MTKLERYRLAIRLMLVSIAISATVIFVCSLNGQKDASAIAVVVFLVLNLVNMWLDMLYRKEMMIQLRRDLEEFKRLIDND